jgi:hypothetical protein
MFFAFAAPCDFVPTGFLDAWTGKIEHWRGGGVEEWGRGQMEGQARGRG